MIKLFLKLLRLKHCYICRKLYFIFCMEKIRYSDDYNDKIGYKALTCKKCTNNLIEQNISEKGI